MPTQPTHPCRVTSLSRRQVLKTGLAAGAMLSIWSLQGPPALWST
jgi:hypothetical protein